MAYGSALVDNIQSSTANTPVVFKDGNGTQIGKLARAWGRFIGSSASITGSFNISSITRSSAGVYVVSFTTAMPNSTYIVTGNASNESGASNGVFSVPYSTISTTGFTINTVNTFSVALSDYGVTFSVFA